METAGYLLPNLPTHRPATGGPLTGPTHVASPTAVTNRASPTPSVPAALGGFVGNLARAAAAMVARLSPPATTNNGQQGAGFPPSAGFPAANNGLAAVPAANNTGAGFPPSAGFPAANNGEATFPFGGTGTPPGGYKF